MLPVPYDRLIVGNAPIVQINGVDPYIINNICTELNKHIHNPKTYISVFGANIIGSNNYNNQYYMDLIQLTVVMLQFSNGSIELAAKEAFKIICSLIALQYNELINILDKDLINKILSNINKIINYITSNPMLGQMLNMKSELNNVLLKYASEKGIMLQLGGMKQMHNTPIMQMNPMSNINNNQTINNPFQSTQAMSSAIVNIKENTNVHKTIMPPTENIRTVTGNDKTEVTDKANKINKDNNKWYPGDDIPPLNSKYGTRVLKQKSGLKYWGIEMNEKDHTIVSDDEVLNEITSLLRENADTETDDVKNIQVIKHDKPLVVSTYEELLPVFNDKINSIRSTTIVSELRVDRAIVLSTKQRKVDENYYLKDIVNNLNSLVDFIETYTETKDLRSPVNDNIIESVVKSIISGRACTFYNRLFDIENVLKEVNVDTIRLLMSELPGEIIQYYINWLKDYWVHIRQATNSLYSHIPGSVLNIIDTCEFNCTAVVFPIKYVFIDMDIYGIDTDDIAAMVTGKDKGKLRRIQSVNNIMLVKILDQVFEHQDDPIPVVLVDVSKNIPITMHCGINLIYNNYIISAL